MTSRLTVVKLNWTKEVDTLHVWMEAAIEGFKTNTVQFDVEGKF
jgi:hypothetical protein